MSNAARKLEAAAARAAESVDALRGEPRIVRLRFAYQCAYAEAIRWAQRHARSGVQAQLEPDPLARALAKARLVSGDERRLQVLAMGRARRIQLLIARLEARG